MRELRHLKWRLLYALFIGRAAERVFVWILRVYAALRGVDAADGAISAFERRYVYSGWPLYGYGWCNLHTSRFAVAVRRQLHRRTATTDRRPITHRPPRIGCVGQFVGLLGFPKVLMTACPAELVIADVCIGTRDAGYLRDCAFAYQAFNLNGGARAIADVGGFLRSSDVDLVLNIGHKQMAHDILDLVDAPCIANYCAGSDLLHHPKVDIQYHGQPEADYFVADGRMFCGMTARPFSDAYVHTITGYIDPRGLPLQPVRAWAEREPLIVCHGSLFKFASAPWLDVLFAVLAADRRTRLVLMGRDAAQALARIRQRADHWGVAGQVDYEGQFTAVRNATGDVDATGWHRLIDLLGRARLAPDPFPIGGGSARFEAYAMGAPAVHLGVRFDRDAWCRPQPGNCEIPSLAVPRGTAWSREEYAVLCRRCLTDGAFADAVAEEQLGAARNVADGRRWWREILEGYERWRQAGDPRRARAA